jgi:putative FmdB family regulatory protein
MPRYNYQCDDCGVNVTVIHTIDESYDDCLACGEKDKMVKLLSSPFIIRKQNMIHDNKKVGELTKEYINENKRILEQHKEEIKGEEYESS